MGFPPLAPNLFAISSLVVLVMGCGGSEASFDGDPGPAPSGDATAGTSAAAGATAGGGRGGEGAVGGSSEGGVMNGAGAGSSGDLPCEVQALLATKCASCHSVDPPGKLLSAADFSRPSKAEPGKTVGALSVERLTATGASRMPPAPLEAATADEIAALSSWIADGAPATSCGSEPVPTTPNPYDTPVVCTSMKNWTGGDRESPLMHPGVACINCHTKEGEGPRFSLAGTVFPTAHEPNDCNGVDAASGAKVVITDAAGKVVTLSVNNAGNFFLETRDFAFPYQAKVTYEGRERVMVSPQQNGDCNACHTQSGTMNAPGRIFLP